MIVCEATLQVFGFCFHCIFLLLGFRRMNVCLECLWSGVGVKCVMLVSLMEKLSTHIQFKIHVVIAIILQCIVLSLPLPDQNNA